MSQPTQPAAASGKDAIEDTHDFDEQQRAGLAYVPTEGLSTEEFTAKIDEFCEWANPQAGDDVVVEVVFDAA